MRKELKLNIKYQSEEVTKNAKIYIESRRMVVDKVFSDEFGKLFIEKRINKYLYV